MSMLLFILKECVLTSKSNDRKDSKKVDHSLPSLCLAP